MSRFRHTAHLGLDEKGETQLYINSSVSLTIWGSRLEKGVKFPDEIYAFHADDVDKTPSFCMRVLMVAQEYLDEIFNKNEDDAARKPKVLADKKTGRKKRLG